MDSVKVYEKFLDSLVSRKLVLFGASKAAYIAVDNFLINEDVLFFCDNDKNKWGTKFNNKVVYSPEKLLEQKDEITILITSEFSEEIKDQLENMGIVDNVYSYSILDFKTMHSQHYFNEGYKLLLQH